MGNIADDDALVTGTVQELECSCPACGGEAVLLGSLGSKVWLRCADCGMDFSPLPPAEPGSPMDRLSRMEREAPFARLCMKPVADGQHANSRCNRDEGHKGACCDAP